MKNQKITAKIPTIVDTSPEAAAIISKLNRGSEKEVNLAKAYTKSMPDISNSIRERLVNNENIAQLFPDVELAIQILTSSILAPNDMVTTSLIYTPPEMGLPSEINNFILDNIKKHIDHNTKLEDKLSDILRESLFTKGSYIEAIIPEASLDEIINSDVEPNGISVEERVNKILVSKGKGILGAVDNYETTISNEQYNLFIHDNTKKDIKYDIGDVDLTITDDPNVLVVSNLLINNINNKAGAVYGSGITISTEDSDGIAELDNIFRKINIDKSTPFISVNTEAGAVRESIGRPLVMKLPVESVIPVHVAGDVTKHIGYFVLLDEKGAPITSISTSSNFKDDLSDLSSQHANKLNIIKKAKTALTGITKKDPKLEDIEEIYSAIVTDQIKNKLKTGMYGDLVDVNDNADIYRTMLTRSLKSQKTKLLFLPKKIVAFYAFDYRDNGTGKSMLEKVAMLFSIRAIILFSKLMASIKNSITTTEVSATLDDNDIDPEGTMEKIISESMKTRQTQLPLGVTKIDDLVDWTHKVGFKYKFKHPGLPDMEINTTDEGTSKIIPDDGLDAMIQEHIVMSFGLTPEMVKSGYDPAFATTVLANNILLAKRVIQYQDKLSPMVTDHVIKLVINDKRIVDNITEIVKNNLVKIKKSISKYNITEDTNVFDRIKDDKVLISYIVDRYINNILIEFPQPATQETTNMKDAYENYVAVVDNYLTMLISNDSLPDDMVGEMSGSMDSVRNIMKTVLVKKWVSDNGYLPEINDFLTKDDEGNPVFNLLGEYSEYTKALAETLLPFLKANKKFIDATNEKISALEEEDNDTNDTDTSTTAVEPDDADKEEDGDITPDATSATETDDSTKTDDDKDTSTDTTGDDDFKL